jgi:hypothetical protein
MSGKSPRLTALPEELRPLLEEVVRKRNRELAALVLTGELGRLSARDYGEIRLSLGKELCETGLDQDEEPNKRGHEIEDLIDWVGARIRWAEDRAAAEETPAAEISREPRP